MEKKSLPNWLQKILLDRRLSTDQVVLILSTPFMQKNDDGSYYIKGRDLAYHCRTSDKTGTRALEGLEELGIVEIVEKKEGRKGGFTFLFKDALVASMLAAFLLTGGTLHKPNYQTEGDLRSNGERNIYYMTTTEVQ